MTENHTDENPTERALREAGFAGPEDYIEKITYAIWNLPERDPELIRRWYAPDCVIHTDWGDLRGVEAVIANTRDRMNSYPDFHGEIDDTIWVARPDGTVRTSMRWHWTGTDTGGTVFGPATSRRVQHIAIAECVVDHTMITREWLGSDLGRLSGQLGSLPARSRSALINTRSESDPERFVDSSLDASAEPAGNAVTTALEAYVHAELPTAQLIVHDQYSSVGETAGPERVATRGEIRLGDERGSVNLIAHHHLRGSEIVEQWVLIDQLATMT